MCYWQGDEDDLERVIEGDGDTAEIIDACPNCKTDAYLMDLDEAAIC